MSKSEYYQKHLDRVSRSFAFSISMLEEPLREYVGLSYLLCRVIDTYEDSKWDTKANQLLSLAQLKEAFLYREAVDILSESPQGMSGAKPDEIALLKDSKLLMRDYYQLPGNIQKHIRKLAITMIDGMSHFLMKNSKSKIRITSISQLNQYCLFVAGIVGECLTHLSNEIEKKTKVTKKKMYNSLVFGLFLQKVNILKDQKDDETEGRHFLPSRDLVYKSVIKHVDVVKGYIHSIPSNQKSYKVFCLSAFLLGLKTLEFVSPDKSVDIKVSRKDAEMIFRQLFMVADDKNMLDAIIEEFKTKIPENILKEAKSMQNRVSLELYDQIQVTLTQRVALLNRN